MVGLSVAAVNDVLITNRFVLTRGDAGRVALAVTAAGSGDDATILRCAAELGLPRRECGPKPKPSAGCDPRKGTVLRGERQLIKSAAQWVAERAAGELECEEATDGFVNAMLDGAIRGKQAVEVDDSTPWDSSTSGRMTDHPHDLSRWATIGDYLDEPSGNTVATYVSGMGLLAERLREQWEPEVRSYICDILHDAAGMAESSAPAEIGDAIKALGDAGELREFVTDDCYDALSALGRDEFYLLGRIEETPFRETLLARRPKARRRLEADIAAAERKRAAHEQAARRVKDVVASVASGFEGRRLNADDAYEMVNAIVSVVRSAADIPLARLLFGHESLAPFLTNGARRRLAEMAEAWLGLVNSRPLDFSSRLAVLFRCLDDARTVEGRHWYVTVTHGPVGSTFSDDNWAFFAQYAAAGGIAGLPSRYSVVVRRFEILKDEESGLPFKSIGGLLIDGRDVALLDADGIRRASSFHCRTGAPLEREPCVRFVDMADLCPAFAETLKRPDQTTEDDLLSFLSAAKLEAGAAPCFASVAECAEGLRVTVATAAGVLEARVFDGPGLTRTGVISVVEDIMPLLPSGSSAEGRDEGGEPSATDGAPSGFVPQIIQGGKT